MLDRALEASQEGGGCEHIVMFIEDMDDVRPVK